MAKGLPLESLLTETDTPYFPKKKVYLRSFYDTFVVTTRYYWTFSIFHQDYNLAIGVPGLAQECAKEIAALRGDNLSTVLAAVRNNVRDLQPLEGEIERPTLLFEIDQMFNQ